MAPDPASLEGKKPSKKPATKYCEMCDRWFTKDRECPACGMPLRKGAVYERIR